MNSDTISEPAQTQTTEVQAAPPASCDLAAPKPKWRYSFTPTLDEARLAHNTAGVHLLKSLKQRKAGAHHWLTRLSILLLALGCGVFVLQFAQRDVRMLMGFLVLYVAMVITFRLAWSAWNKRALDTLAHRTTLEEQTIELSEAGVVMRNAHGAAQAAWHEIKFMESDKALLSLSRDIMPTFYLPQRAVPSDAWPALHTQIKQWQLDAQKSNLDTNAKIHILPIVNINFRKYINISVAFLLAVSLLLSPLWEPQASRWAWNKQYGPYQAQAEDEAPLANAASEEWLYGAHQNALDEALEAVPKNVNGQPSLYALSVAGVASQRVFEREVKAVSQLMKDSGAVYAGQLINSKTTLNDAPIATLTSLTDMITRIGQQMNREQDVLLLYLTSHGSNANEGHEFQLEHGGVELAQLRPEDLRTLLDAARIKHRVIIVSACYAGGWANAMKDENTVVMMAARADRTSFGCSDHNDWTWFGEALMKEQWPLLKNKNWDLKAAFDAAKAVIAKREKANDYEASEPQASFGAAGLAQFQAVMKAAVK